MKVLQRLPEGWKKTTLGKVAKFGSGTAKPNDMSERNSAGRYPVYGGNGVIGYSSEYNAEGPEIIIGRVGDKCGCVHVSESACWVTDNAILVKDRYVEIYHHFFAEALRTAHLENISAKGGLPLITRSLIKSVPILLPPFPEQRAIADLLSTWNEVIAKTEQLIHAKENKLRGQIQKLIGKKCDSWPHIKPEEIFDTIAEKNFPNEELLSVTQDRGVIPRRILNMRVMSPDGTTASYKRIKQGDFAISLRSFQGGIEYSNYQGIISPAYTVLRPKIVLSRDFYRLFFKSYIFIEKYLSRSVTGIRDGKQINIPEFLSIKIPNPPLTEQQEIAGALSIAKEEINLLEQLVEKYETQKRGLMQKILSGEWRMSSKFIDKFSGKSRRAQ